MAAAATGEEWALWLRLAQTPRVGSGAARTLLSAFGLPGNIFAASLGQLRQHVPDETAQALRAPPSGELSLLCEQTAAWLAQSGNHILTLADAAYPVALLSIPDPPIMLYVKGQVALLSAPSFAIVGSRRASRQGAQDAEKIAEALGHAGLTIVSGMALGIDAAAHYGGLATAAATIAVVGTGADKVYPSRNHALAHRIAEEGCLVGEYPLGTPALPANFPRRNRIISGLSCGVLVVEATKQSGSLITARMALEQGRDVFAVPGSIHSPLSGGCHQLIRQGAKLVETAQDILEELPEHRTGLSRAESSRATDDTGNLSSVAHAILHEIGFSPMDVETLSQLVRADMASLNAELLTLELAGKLECLPGGAYRRLVS